VLNKLYFKNVIKLLKDVFSAGADITDVEVVLYSQPFNISQRQSDRIDSYSHTKLRL